MTGDRFSSHVRQLDRTQTQNVWADDALSLSLLEMCDRNPSVSVWRLGWRYTIWGFSLLNNVIRGEFGQNNNDFLDLCNPQATFWTFRWSPSRAWSKIDHLEGIYSVCKK